MTQRGLPAVLAALMLILAPAQSTFAQSFDGIIRQVPGRVLEEILRQQEQPRRQQPTVPEVVRPKVVIDDIPAERCMGIQSALASLNFDVGTVDGQCGPRTRRAIAAYQESLGADPSGQLTSGQEQALLAQGTPQTVVPSPAPSAQPVPPPPPSVAFAGDLEGQWSGTYVCGQGETALLLSFSPKSGDVYKGSFKFGPTPDNPRVPEGEYAITAELSSDGDISIEPGRWLKRPAGYVTAPLTGEMAADGASISGRIEAGGCTVFRVARGSPPATETTRQPEPAPVAASPAEPAEVAETPAPAPERADAGDAQTDCSLVPESDRADCEVFKQQATAVYFGADTALPSIQRSCRALETGLSEADLVQCLAGAWAVRETVRFPTMLFKEGWRGLGPSLEATSSCQAAVTAIRNVAAAVLGQRSSDELTVDKPLCQSLAMMALSRQSRPAWGLCAMGTDDANAYLECGGLMSAASKTVWLRAVEVCAAGQQPDAFNRTVRDAAQSNGRPIPPMSCDAIEQAAQDGGIFTAEEVAATKMRVAEEVAAAEERRRVAEAAAAERRRQQEEEAAERRKRQAEAEERARQAAAAEAERVAAERAANPNYGRLEAPSQFAAIARAIENGERYNFTDASLLFTAGIAAELLENCRAGLETADRLELASFVAAASLQAGGGNQYSAPNLNDMMADQAGSLGTYAAGALAARAMQCGGASDILENILKLVRQNKTGSNGGQSPFIASCTPVHGQASCTCLAELGRASYSNIYQMQYSRDVIYGIIQNNPVAAMMIGISCGISRY